MMIGNNKEEVTVVAIGESGVGKSQNGCAYLQMKNAFEADSRPDSCTYLTSVQCNEIDGTIRYYIDTQGLASSDNDDAEYIQQMISFIKSWDKGVNAFFIVLNIQNPRFDSGIQQLIRIINSFFNNPDFWNQTGIVFTRCYPGYFDREMAETRYRESVIQFIKKLPNCDQIDPEMPCFFVDSVNWENDESTQIEYERMFNYASQNYPVPTHDMIPVSPDYQDVEEEYLDNVVVNTEYQGEGPDRKKIITYENQKRFKFTLWDGSIRYSDAITVDSWDEEIESQVFTESKNERKSDRTEIFRAVEATPDIGEILISGFLGLSEQRIKYEHDHYETVTYNTEYTRNRIIDPDGNVTYTEWSPENQWSEVNNE